MLGIHLGLGLVSGSGLGLGYIVTCAVAEYSEEGNIIIVITYNGVIT